MSTCSAPQALVRLPVQLQVEVRGQPMEFELEISLVVVPRTHKDTHPALPRSYTTYVAHMLAQRVIEARDGLSEDI
jgi:hypothetical protein